MRQFRLCVMVGLLMLPAGVFAQAPQVTNDDLLRLIGLQQVQNLQLGKVIDACQQEVAKLKETKKDASPSPSK